MNLSHNKRPEERVAQKQLAHLVTLLVHGQEELDTALKTTEILYHNQIEKLLEMSQEEIDKSFRGVPTVQMMYR